MQWFERYEIWKDGGGRFFSSGIRPPADPFVLFWDISILGPEIFWRTINFVKVFRGCARRKKRHFLSKFSKVPKTPVLFTKICLFLKQAFLVLWESSENNLIDLKKGRPLPPPLEKILDPPLCLISDNGCFVCFGAQVSSTFFPCSRKIPRIFAGFCSSAAQVLLIPKTNCGISRGC